MSSSHRRERRSRRPPRSRARSRTAPRTPANASRSRRGCRTGRRGRRRAAVVVVGPVAVAVVVVVVVVVVGSRRRWSFQPGLNVALVDCRGVTTTGCRTAGGSDVVVLRCVARRRRRGGRLASRLSAGGTDAGDRDRPAAVASWWPRPRGDRQRRSSVPHPRSRSRCGHPARRGCRRPRGCVARFARSRLRSVIVPGRPVNCRRRVGTLRPAGGPRSPTATPRRRWWRRWSRRRWRWRWWWRWSRRRWRWWWPAGGRRVGDLEVGVGQRSRVAAVLVGLRRAVLDADRRRGGVVEVDAVARPDSADLALVEDRLEVGGPRRCW